MRLFLLAFSVSALLTAISGLSNAQEPFESAPQPIRQSRFEPSPAQAYLIARARQDAEHRTAMLRRYDLIGFNYGAPEINGSVSSVATPPFRYRRVFYMPMVGWPVSNTN